MEYQVPAHVADNPLVCVSIRREDFHLLSFRGHDVDVRRAMEVYFFDCKLHLTSRHKVRDPAANAN